MPCEDVRKSWNNRFRCGRLWLDSRVAPHSILGIKPNRNQTNHNNPSDLYSSHPAEAVGESLPFYGDFQIQQIQIVPVQVQLLYLLFYPLMCYPTCTDPVLQIIKCRPTFIRC